MPSRFYSVVVDSHDPARLARFWAEVLDYAIAYEAEDEVAIEPPADGGPALVFVPVPEGKAVKNRLHIDLDPDDQQAEVQRLRSLGAAPVDVGQRDASWVVLADPEGNEFCVLTPRA